MLVFAIAALALQGSDAIAAENAIVPAILIYFVLTGTLLGTTPGQRLMGLIVTRLERSPPSRGQRFLRPIAALVTVLTFGAGFFWAARSPRHQAVHDLITRTLVLRR